MGEIVTLRRLDRDNVSLQYSVGSHDIDQEIPLWYVDRALDMIKPDRVIIQGPGVIVVSTKWVVERRDNLLGPSEFKDHVQMTPFKRRF